MTSNRAVNAYQKTNFKTADPVTLIIMCYERAIRDLEEARQSHVQGQMDPAYQKIRHVQDIVTELLVALDYEQGGEIARNLSRLYNFVLRELIGINSRKPAKVYGDLIRILAELKDAWVEVRAQHGKEALSLHEQQGAKSGSYLVSA